MSECSTVQLTLPHLPHHWSTSKLIQPASKKVRSRPNQFASMRFLNYRAQGRNVGVMCPTSYTWSKGQLIKWTRKCGGQKTGGCWKWQNAGRHTGHNSRFISRHCSRFSFIKEKSNGKSWKKSSSHCWTLPTLLTPMDANQSENY